jgi:hypothetical protein
MVRGCIEPDPLKRFQSAGEVFAEGAAVAPKVALLPANVGAMELLLGHKKEARMPSCKA